MKKRKNIALILLIIILLVGILLYLAFGGNKLFERIQGNIKKEEETNVTNDDFNISDNEGNSVNLIFTRTNGITKIEYPTGFEITCSNKEKVSIDFKVEENKEYTFKVIDSAGTETYESFITPEGNIQLTKTNINITLDDIVASIRSELNKKNIATNFIKMVIGDSNSVSSTTTKVDTIFSNWQSFGDGNWGYDSSNNWIYNTKNSSYITGYYDPTGDYENIELEFEAKTTDGDDDMIGSMIRFNSLGNNLYSSYFFTLDRHDNGGGIGNRSL